MIPSPQLLSSAEQEQRYLYIRTFGCQMNEYDSLRVQHLLTPLGYSLTDDMKQADVIFLNTCSVREKAEHKVYSFLGRLRSLKVRHPGLKIVVAGCVAQQLGEKLLERFDHLDLVVGTRGIPSVDELLERVQKNGERIAFLPEKEEGRARNRLFRQPLQVTTGVVAPVTIMQGCNNFCTYCIVPYVRGRERSRPSSEIIEEIRLLEAGGAREILLLGQNVNSYGNGLHETITFAELLRRITSETGVSRLRFTTSHPKDLTDELIACFAELPALCKHIHLPFQAGSDRVLQRMNRGYTAAHYRDRIRALREACPDVGLSSDVMVGFPGETEEDFTETYRLVEEVQFDNLFSFRYSDRPFAQAATFPDKIPEVVKARRLIDLQALQAQITLRKNESEVGAVREILVESSSKSGNGQLTGRTQQNRIVNFEGPEELIGRMISVRITAAFSHSLRGEIFGEP